MPLKINLKKKDPGFKGDLPKWHITISAPNEIFPEKVEKFLYLHGVMPFVSNEGYQIWSTAPNIGAPPLYLALELERKYGARFDANLKQMIDLAVMEREPEDGLERFLGRDAEIPAGCRRLSVRAGETQFVANCDENNHERILLLKGAGWLPIENPPERVRNALGSMPFRTADPFLASNLTGFMAEAARVRLGQGLKAAKANIAISKSHEAPEDFSVSVPEGLGFMSFQKAGISQILSSGKSGIIADDMGLGKTIQGIGILNGRPDARNVIVFCQANMKLKWAREILKWKTDPDLTVGHAEGDDFPDTDIVVINYDIVARHMDRIRARRWDLELVDEAHNLANEEAIRTNAILGDLLEGTGKVQREEVGPVPLGKNGIVVHLTGTPKPNRVRQLWPLLTSTRPDIWGSGVAARQAFLDRYEPPVLIRKKMKKGNREYEMTIPLPGKPIREMELQMRMRGSGSFIRRLKRDTDLPPKFRTPIEMPFVLSEETRRALVEIDTDFERLHAELVQQTQSHTRVGKSERAAAVIDVIKGLAPSSPAFHEIGRMRRNLGILKAPYIGEFLCDEAAEDAELAPELRRKTVVFAHHKDVIRILAERIERDFPGEVLIYDGSVSSKKRQENVDLFMENPTKRFFIMSLAGATGITLTSSSRMRIAEADWLPSNMAQIEDRIWRIGQEENCDIGYLFIPNSLDVTMGMSIIGKMEVDERALNDLNWNDLGKRKTAARRRASDVVSDVLDGDGDPATMRAQRETAQLSMDL